MALSSDDKKWIKNNFAGKKDLLDLRKIVFGQGLESDEKFGRLEKKMDDRFGDVMTSLDMIMKEVSAGREHDLVVTHQQKIQDDRLDVLEKAVGV